MEPKEIKILGPDLGLRDYEITAEGGWTQSTFSQWANGERTPSRKNTQKLVDIAAHRNLAETMRRRGEFNAERLRDDVRNQGLGIRESILRQVTDKALALGEGRHYVQELAKVATQFLNREMPMEFYSALHDLIRIADRIKQTEDAELIADVQGMLEDAMTKLTLYLSPTDQLAHDLRDGLSEVSASEENMAEKFANEIGEWLKQA